MLILRIFINAFEFFYYMGYDIGSLIGKLICNRVCPPDADLKPEIVKMNVLEKYALFKKSHKFTRSKCEDIFSEDYNPKLKTSKVDYFFRENPLCEMFIQYLYGLHPMEQYSSKESYQYHKNCITGDIFEDYCLQLFPPVSFDFIVCTQRRGWPIVADGNRDVKLRHKRSSKVLNIDFKFRRNKDDPFVKHKQVTKYGDYNKKEENYYLVIGFGNQPFNPYEMYIFPIPLLTEIVDRYGDTHKASDVPITYSDVVKYHPLGDSLDIINYHRNFVTNNFSIKEFHD